MKKEHKCIAELYSILAQIEANARHCDFSLLRTPRGASGCDMYQGLPPISRMLDAILDVHGDIINEALRSNEECLTE